MTRLWIFKKLCSAMAPALSSRHFLLGMTVGLSVAFLLVGFSSTGSGPSGMRNARIINDPGDRDFHSKMDRLMQAQGGSIIKEAAPAGGHAMDDQHFHDEMDERIHKEGRVRANFDEDKPMHDHDDESEAIAMKEKVRVLVWIMTSPDNLEKKASVVRDTWTKRANKVIFFSSTTDPSFPTIGLDTEEGREHLTAKTMKGFRYIYENHKDEADWFMKADDDSYVIMENLRYFLSEQNSSDPVWFGHLFKTIVTQGYYSGGGGYVLSKEALKRLYEGGTDPEHCRQDGGPEDAEIGLCMEYLGVKTANTTDALGRSRFHCFNPDSHVWGGFPSWYYKYDAMGGVHGEESMSDYAISFHYVSPQMMATLEYYIYHLRPFGIKSGSQALNAKHKNWLLRRTNNAQSEEEV